jgi:hypothetical protein
LTGCVSVSTARQPFWWLANSFWSISIISIFFDPFRFWHRNCQTISIARRPFRSVSIQDQNCQNKASQASCMLSTWSHACQPFVIPAPSRGISLGHSAKMSFYSGILHAKFFDFGVSLTAQSQGCSVMSPLSCMTRACALHTHSQTHKHR